MKKALVLVVSLAVIYAATELVSWLILAGVKLTRPTTFVASIDDYFSGMDERDLRAYLAGDYHPILGWDSKPGSESTEKNCLGEYWTESFDADGARSTPEEFDTTLIATYGDSYVKGGEVNNDQTWQFQLAKDLNSGVKNYAVGAYGSDQAMLKAKLHISQGRVYPITVLGINEQNVTRVVNLFRPFLYGRAGARFSFKPGLACEGGTCVAVENLLRPDVETIEEVKVLALEARRQDYWAQHKPSHEYPWSVNLAKLARLTYSSLTSDEPEPLWHTPEGAAAMHHVVADFRSSVLSAGSLPVILFIPKRPDKGMRPSYSDFKEQISKHYPELLVLDVRDTEFNPKRFRLKPAGCHPSEYGHGIIAETVKYGLRDVLATHSTR